jgi:iron(III) transport system permease protein
MAAASTVFALAIAVAAAWLIVRRRVRGRGVIEGLLVLPWALPGTVFAIALATTFAVSRPYVLRWVFVGTVFMLPLAYVVRGLPLVGRSALAGFRQFDPALEEAAASLGVTGWNTFRRVTAPLLRPSLAAGASLAFVTALGDFVTSIVLYTYDNRPISMEILSSLRLNELGIAAAFGVLLMFVSAVALAVGGAVGAERGARG